MTLEQGAQDSAEETAQQTGKAKDESQVDY